MSSHDVTDFINLIDFMQDRIFFVSFFRSFYESLITLELETILRNGKRQSFRLLKDFHTGQ